MDKGGRRGGGRGRGKLCKPHVREPKKDPQIHLAVGQRPVRPLDLGLRDSKVPRTGPQIEGPQRSLQSLASHQEGVQEVRPSRTRHASPLERPKENDIVEARNVVAHPRVSLHQVPQVLTRLPQRHAAPHHLRRNPIQRRGVGVHGRIVLRTNERRELVKNLHLEANIGIHVHLKHEPDHGDFKNVGPGEGVRIIEVRHSARFEVE